MRKKFNAVPINRIILIFLALVLLKAVLAAETGQEEDPALRIRQAIKDKKYDLAIELSREQLARQPENYDFNFLLAQALAFSGRWDEASEVLRKLERLYPGNTDVMLFLARVESWKQNYRAAEELFRQVLESRPGNLEARLGLGDLAAWQGDYSRAIDIYQEALTASKEAGSGLISGQAIIEKRRSTSPGRSESIRRTVNIAFCWKGPDPDSERILKFVTSSRLKASAMSAAIILTAGWPSSSRSPTLDR